MKGCFITPKAIVLLALASSAYADSNSVQADEILAENVRLKAEIALLKARSESKIAQQAAEIVQLNARLRAKRAMADSKMLEGMEEQIDNTRDEIGSLTDGDAANTEAGLGTMFEEEEEGDRQLDISEKLQEQKTCPGNCQGKCFMARKYWDGSCMMNKKTFKQQISPKIITPVGTPESPKWRLSDWKGRALGTVSCPCSVDHKPLSEQDATRKIVGQVAAVGIPGRWLGWMCNKHAKGSKAKVEGLWNARVTLATMTMVKCWKKKCFGKSSSADDSISADVQLSDLLKNEDVSRTNERAGWDCG